VGRKASASVSIVFFLIVERLVGLQHDFSFNHGLR